MSYLVQEALGVGSLDGVPHLHERHPSAGNKFHLVKQQDQWVAQYRSSTIESARQ